MDLSAFCVVTAARQAKTYVSPSFLVAVPEFPGSYVISVCFKLPILCRATHPLISARKESIARLPFTLGPAALGGGEGTLVPGYYQISSSF
jgi:hypothetical protein